MMALRPVPRLGVTARALAEGCLMLSRRDFLQTAAAVAAATGLGGRLSQAAAQQAIRQEDLLAFEPKGQLTILHMADCHAQLKPLHFREPSINIGVGEARGQLPHLTDRELLAKPDIPAGSHEAYMLELRRLRGAGPHVWPRRRHGSHGDRRQGGAGRTRLPARAAAGRW
jgi:hypothetical protein